MPAMVVLLCMPAALRARMPRGAKWGGAAAVKGEVLGRRMGVVNEIILRRETHADAYRYRRSTASGCLR